MSRWLSFVVWIVLTVAMMFVLLMINKVTGDAIGGVFGRAGDAICIVSSDMSGAPNWCADESGVWYGLTLMLLLCALLSALVVVRLPGRTRGDASR